MGADVNLCVHCRSDEDCPDCEAEAAPIRKAAQVAAIRQRLGDIATGAAYGGDRFALPNAIIDVFGCDVDGITPAPEPRTLDSLAAWLWERGVRG